MLKGIISYLKARLGSKKGQGLVEYGLIIGLIAVIIIAAVAFLGQPLKDLFANIGSLISGSANNVH